MELPAGFRDATVNSLVMKRPGGDVTLAVTRIPAEGRTIGVLTEERLKDQKRRLPRFELVKNEPAWVVGLETRDVTIRYADGERTLLQRTASLIVGDRLIVLVVWGLLALEAEIDRIFLKATSTVSLRSESGS